MELSNFVSCFHDYVSQFLEEVNLSGSLSLAMNQPSTLPVKVSPAILTSSLEKLVSNLQDILNSAKTLPETKDNVSQETVITPDPELVQIVATNSEIDRRIQAFMNRKKAEVDEANCREFCSSSGKQDSTCARTDSVFVSRNSSKSHVKVSRVAHAYGPQTRPHLIRAENVKVDTFFQRSPQKRDKNEGLEERLHNMESFLRLRQGQRVPENVYERIKVLEERILHLESISPEYFSITPTAFKRQRLSQSMSEDTDLDDINNRIKQLEESLKKKKGATSVTEVKTSPT